MVSPVLIKALPGSSLPDSSGPSSSVGKQISSSNLQMKASASSILASNAFWSSLHTTYEHSTAFFYSKSQRCHTLVVLCTYPRNIQGFDGGRSSCCFAAPLVSTCMQCIRNTSGGVPWVSFLSGPRTVTCSWQGLSSAYIGAGSRLYVWPQPRIALGGWSRAAYTWLWYLWF
jgi:hypothetical protein